jgi:hypothetical protein
MLYQAGLFILEEKVEEADVQLVSFPEEWYVIKNIQEEIGMSVPEMYELNGFDFRFTLFGRTMIMRIMLVTSKFIPTSASNPSPGGGPSGANAPVYETLRRGLRLHPMDGAIWDTV